MFGFCFGKNNNCIVQGESEFKCQISMFVKIYIMFDGGFVESFLPSMKCNETL